MALPQDYTVMANSTTDSRVDSTMPANTAAEDRNRRNGDAPMLTTLDLTGASGLDLADFSESVLVSDANNSEDGMPTSTPALSQDRQDGDTEMLDALDQRYEPPLLPHEAGHAGDVSEAPVVHNGLPASTAANAHLQQAETPNAIRAAHEHVIRHWNAFPRGGLIETTVEADGVHETTALAYYHDNRHELSNRETVPHVLAALPALPVGVRFDLNIFKRTAGRRRSPRLVELEGEDIAPDELRQGIKASTAQPQRKRACDVEQDDDQAPFELDCGLTRAWRAKRQRQR